MASLYKKVIGGRPYWYLREMGWVDGKPKLVSERYLGTAAEVEALLDARERAMVPERTRHLDFGAVAAAWGLLAGLGVAAIIDEACGGRPPGLPLSPGTYLALAALNRVVDPCSKRAFADWWRTTAADRFTKIPVSALDHRRFWDAMHAVPLQALPRIEEKLALAACARFGLDTSSVALDMTNFATFTGTGNARAPIAQRGKAKQKRADLRLVGLGLVVTRGGGPAGAPTGFVPARWAGYLQTATGRGDVIAYRHYWELCVLLVLRDGLRSGDVFVPGSRRYADPASFLLTPGQWEPRRAEFCQLAGKPADGMEALAAAEDELHAALADLDAQLAAGDPGGVRLNADGELIIPRLAAESTPAEAEALRDELAGMLPVVPVASLLVEVDARAGFTDHLAHAGGQVTRSAELKRHLLYVIIAEATNMGLGEMAISAEISYEALAWTAEWYLRPETLEAASAAIVNYHHRLPFAQVSGTGTLSSSDGQRFPVSGKSITARHLSRYFARGAGISAYTAVSDQHATFDTKVIAANAPEAPYVLDEILGNATDLTIVEHATDTHGATLANADHPPAVPAFRKLDAVAVLTARLLPAPLLCAVAGARVGAGAHVTPRSPRRGSAAAPVAAWPIAVPLGTRLKAPSSSCALCSRRTAYSP